MKREIKFRAWDNVLKEHLLNVQNHIGNDGWAFGQLLKNTDRYTVEQFTGLKDKNGKEIYEGDILLWDVFEKVKVEFAKGRYRGRHIEGQVKANLHYSHFKNSKIIGNVHENPELL